MPTYEYACKSCGEHVEVVQSFKDEPLTTCSVCGGQLRKVFGSIGIAFKGSGFYKNDSRQAPPSESAKSSSSSSEAGSKADGAAKSDAAKSDTAKAGTAKGDAKATAAT
ncbi:MAG: FmdB family transcriptional regulator [Actinomycetota bacterium]|nr:FmdB family transcriptional regulator [Actinomycetota bacterium]